MTRFRIIALCFAMIAVAFTSLAACTEDEKDERDTPLVWKVVSDMYTSFGSKTSCSDVDTALKEVNSTFMSEACQEYDKRRNENGGYEPLAQNKTNSGYYVAAFILFYRLYSEVTLNCSEVRSSVTVKQAQESFDRLIQTAHCDNFFSDSKDFTQKRNL